MPAFLHFYQGAVQYADYYDMPHADWLRLRSYMKQAEQQLRNVPRG